MAWEQRHQSYPELATAPLADWASLTAGTPLTPLTAGKASSLASSPLSSSRLPIIPGVQVLGGPHLLPDTEDPADTPCAGNMAPDDLFIKNNNNNIDLGSARGVGAGVGAGGDSFARTQELLSSFSAAIIHSLHLVLILFIRALLNTGAPFVRRSLTFMGLASFIAEAETGGPAEAALGCHVADAVRPSVPLLPPRHEQDQDRLTIVLDLDETLVCAYNTEGLPPELHRAACQSGLQWFTLDCVSPDEQDASGAPKVHNVTVYQRPGLKEFLAAASQLGELVLFTAGLEGYARPLLDRIDPEGRISFRLYRSATISTYFREHVKDLSMLGRNICRTVLIDNNPFSFLLQPANGIPCVAFTGDNAHDRQLQDVLLPLLEHLSYLPDIRPFLMARFQMPGWFRSRGVPVLDSATPKSQFLPLNPMPASLLPACHPINPQLIRPVS